MNKDEMIEEMANEIDLAKKQLWNAENLKKDDYSWHSKGIATALYNAGYRKMTEDEIVESMKTYESARQETAMDILQELYSTPHEYHEKKIVDLAKAYGIELEN